MRIVKKVYLLYVASSALAVLAFYCPFSSLLFAPSIGGLLLIATCLALRKPRSAWKAHFIGAIALCAVLDLFICPWTLPMAGLNRKVKPLDIHGATLAEFIIILQNTSGYHCFVVEHEHPDIGWKRKLQNLPPVFSLSTSARTLGGLMEELNSSLGVIVVPQGVGGLAESLSGHYSMRGITVHILAPSHMSRRTAIPTPSSTPTIRGRMVSR